MNTTLNYPIDFDEMITRQAKKPCLNIIENEDRSRFSVCMSYYRNGDYCNKCGAFLPQEVDEENTVKYIPHNVYRTYKKKLH